MKGGAIVQPDRLTVLCFTGEAWMALSKASYVSRWAKIRFLKVFGPVLAMTVLTSILGALCVIPAMFLALFLSRDYRILDNPIILGEWIVFAYALSVFAEYKILQQEFEIKEIDSKVRALDHVYRLNFISYVGLLIIVVAFRRWVNLY